MALYSWFKDNKKCPTRNEHAIKPLSTLNNSSWWPILRSPPKNNILIAKSDNTEKEIPVKQLGSYILKEK